MTETAADITARVGPKRSGRTRYAAAMSLYNAGKLSDTALEIYRTCSLLDGQDPGPLLIAAGVAPAEMRQVTGDAAIGGLIEAADGYLATLQGPGVAEVRTGLNQ